MLCNDVIILSINMLGVLFDSYHKKNGIKLSKYIDLPLIT